MYGVEVRCVQGLVDRPNGYRLLGRHRCRWENNIKIDMHEMEWGGMDWTALARDRNRWQAFVNTVNNLRIPQNEEEFLH